MERYENLKKELIEKFDKTIPKDDSDRDELIEGFDRRLDVIKDKVTQNVIVKSSWFLTRNAIKTRADRIIALDLDTKKRSFVKDVNMEKLRKLSDRAFELAKKTLLTGDRLSDKMEINGLYPMIDKLEELRKSVRSFNRDEAKDLVGLAKEDFSLAYAPGAESVSTRIIRVYAELSKSEREKIDRRRYKNSLKYRDEIATNNKKREDEDRREWSEMGLTDEEIEIKEKAMVKKRIPYLRVTNISKYREGDER